MKTRFIIKYESGCDPLFLHVGSYCIEMSKEPKLNRDSDFEYIRRKLLSDEETTFGERRFPHSEMHSISRLCNDREYDSFTIRVIDVDFETLTMNVVEGWHFITRITSNPNEKVIERFNEVI